MKKIIAAQKKLVIPTKSLIKSKEEIAHNALNLVKNEIKKYPSVIGVEFGGSFAKGTWLAKDADIDIFLKFKESTAEKEFEEFANKIGFSSMKKFNPYVRYSEHPYVEAQIKNTKINIVPCYDVKKGQWKSSADRSPYHTKFMQNSLTSKMKDEVRILKTFLKSVGIYGAEIATQGFSGYVSEVLILNFDTFENVIKSISKIKENHVIGKASKKFETAITIIDPIDSNRNLAAAISNQNIGKFVLACRSFQANPSNKFFRTSKLKTSVDWDNVLTVKFEFKMRSPDIIWGQIKRAVSSLSTQLEFGGFRVFRSMPYTDEKKEAYLLFLLESVIIPKRYAKKGPEFFREDGCKSFIGKNASKTELMWIDNDYKIISLEKRKHDNAITYIKEILKKNLQTGIPKGLQNDLRKGFKIYVGSKQLRKSIKEEVLEIISTDEKIFYSNK